MGTSEVCHPQYSSSLFSCHNSVSGDGITVWRKFKIFLFVKYPKNGERYLKKCFNKSYIIPLCLLNSVGKISEISMIFELFLSSFLQSIFFNIHIEVSLNISFSYLRIKHFFQLNTSITIEFGVRFSSFFHHKLVSGRNTWIIYIYFKYIYMILINIKFNCINATVLINKINI